VQSVECLNKTSDGAVCLTIVESARYVPNGNRHLQEFILRAHTSVVFKKVDGQVNIFGGNGQTGQEHISKDESIRHLSTIYCYQHRSAPASSKLLLRSFTLSKLVLFSRSFTVSAFSIYQ
jgi:hypothetical protein